MGVSEKKIGLGPHGENKLRAEYSQLSRVGEAAALAFSQLHIKLKRGPSGGLDAQPRVYCVF